MSSSPSFIRRRRVSSGAVFLILAALSAVPAQAAVVRGSVKLNGPPPPQEVFTAKAKSKQHSVEGCGSLGKASPKLRVDAAGGVRDAVVWLEGQGQAGPQVSPVLMDQKECVFFPHVAVVPLGGSVAIRNSDKVIHNVRIFADGKPSTLMHQWQKADAPDILWKFTEPGRYIVRCGVHPWMYGWVVVSPATAPAAVTDEAGGFVLAGVPEGAHTLNVWHETLGTRQVRISVDSKEEELEAVRFDGKGAR